ncbi:MAG: DUF6465 family protein [Lachnospiraceae bacterium]
MATKKEVTKAAVSETKAAASEPEKKTAAKAEMAKASTEDKVTEKKTATKKTAAKKAPAKKTAAKKTTAKKEMKVSTVIQYYGKEVEEKEIVANIKKAWTKAGHKVGDIQTMELYIKPEDGAVYYVINGSEGGAVAF